jgi:hydrophobe/amphiphile efflux-3 (HAE3) family protein
MFDRLFEGIAGTINRRPRLVAALVLILFGISIYGMTQLTMESGWNTYLDENSEKGIIYSDYLRNFPSESTIILILETSDPLSTDNLKYLDDLESGLRKQQNVATVQSIVEVLKSAHGGTLPTSRAEIDQIVGLLPSATRDLVIPSNTLTLVQVQLEQGLSADAETVALNNLISAVDSSAAPPGVTVEISGSPAFHQQMEEGLESNMAILIGGAMMLMVIAMGILFAYVRHRFMPVLLVGIGLMTSLGLMGLAGVNLNMAVIGAFPVLIGLGIDYAIQFHARFDEESRRGSLENAVVMTVTRTGPAVMFAMLATCMGFMAMFVSEVPMVRSFALVAIIGIFTSFWVSCIGVPTLGLLLHYRPKEPKTDTCYAVGTGACDSLVEPSRPDSRRDGKKRSFSYGEFLTTMSVRIAKHPLPLLLIFGCIAFAGFQIDSLIAIQTSENAFVPGDMPAKINIDKVTRILGATSTADFYVQGDGTDLETVRWMQQFQEYELGHHPELTSATSIVTCILAYNGGVMPDSQGSLDAVLERIPEEVRTQYVSGSMDAVMKFGTADLDMTQMESLKTQMEQDIAFLQPPMGIHITPVGSFDLYTTMLTTLAQSKEMMTYLGFIFVGIFLIVVYRHFHAVSPMIPIIFVIGWNAVMMYVLNISYTPLTATLGSMTIGIAAEYTILVMERYAEERDRLGDNLAAIQESVHKIGTAITVSGLATFFGFSALCLATFPIISNFGVTTLIAVGFSLVGAIFVMPAVLSVIGRFEKPAGRVDEVVTPSPIEEIA